MITFKETDLKLNLEKAFPDSVNNEIFEPIIEYTELEHRILFFGDSFVNVGAELNWTRKLCKIYNRQSWNYGRGGSSLLFSINNFFRYIENDYREDDYIVFVTTSHTRFPKVHSKVDPGISAALMNYVMKFWPNAREDIYYYDWQSHLVKWLAMVYCNQEDFRHQCMMIDNYLKHLPNKTVLLPAFHVQNWAKSKTFCLYDIAELTNYKAPINHMTELQNMTLANQINNYWQNDDYSVFDIKEY